MRKYHQLTIEEREKIAMLRQSKPSLAKIAIATNRSKSTISRELRRNQSPPGEYWPDTAQSLAIARRERVCRLDRDEDLRNCVITKLCCHYWSPEAIAGWLSSQQKEIRSISHESIYAWIYQKSQKKDKLWKFLARHKAKRGLRKSKGAGMARIPNRVSIHDRPKIIDSKKEFGHWEGDLMSFMKNSQHILVLRERISMFTLSVVLLATGCIILNELRRGFLNFLKISLRCNFYTPHFLKIILLVVIAKFWTCKSVGLFNAIIS